MCPCVLLATACRYACTHGYCKVTDMFYVSVHVLYYHSHIMFATGHITEDTCKYLTKDTDRTQQFYVMPKIHKLVFNPQGDLW